MVYYVRTEKEAIIAVKMLEENYHASYHARHKGIGTWDFLLKKVNYYVCPEPGPNFGWNPDWYNGWGKEYKYSPLHFKDYLCKL